MGSARIVLSGLCPKLMGLTWESDALLRIGRQGNAEVVLRDFSVDRLHAEVKNQGPRWVVRDLAHNPLYPTLVNNVRLGDVPQPLRSQDVIQVGKLLLKVSELQDPEAAVISSPGRATVAPAPPAAGQKQLLAISGVRQVCVEATAQASWEQALERVTLNPEQHPLHAQAMLTLVRANHHLAHLGNLDDLLQSILGDAVSTLAAQRGTIILADPATGALTLKASLEPGTAQRTSRLGYSKTLIKRSFQLGESLLCRDINSDRDLLLARSVRAGTMSSIVCALLRTPRRRLGVLHLDRGPFQESFTESDLYIADAIAASVAVGIESAQLIEMQREQFLQTVTTLARTVEARDQYTGDHTRRVTEYALLLADELQVSALERHLIEVGTPLHDIGKIAIDDAILRKPGKLSEGEFEAMKTHTVKGAALLDSMFSLVPMIPIVRHHHERWDGSGYPDRLSREQIPLNARVVAVADAFDAMTSHRPYRQAMRPDQAFLELIRKAGSHFDPGCVQAFLHVRPRIEAMIQASIA
jgi:HD-GYP domain-containing protein (c-di-GMP phosphodiesterase class II)/pSer/pThr/pTyr-binding forkhead associated (FHA) protein